MIFQAAVTAIPYSNALFTACLKVQLLSTMLDADKARYRRMVEAQREEGVVYACTRTPTIMSANRKYKRWLPSPSSVRASLSSLPAAQGARIAPHKPLPVQQPRGEDECSGTVLQRRALQRSTPSLEERADTPRRIIGLSHRIRSSSHRDLLVQFYAHL